MKVVALISGGKDSCFNMMQCVAEGHDLIALANLHPQQVDELDSYMFQTVGHHAIDLYSQAMGLPLYRAAIKGGSVEQGRDYRPTQGDEVEDLYLLLKQVKEELKVDAVSVGAILSNYQRVRVENVCLRLGLTPLAYLWRRDQSELLDEMINAGVNAIIIKVAALGLKKLHLGKTISEIQPYMEAMKTKYHLNVCGEGGEYETFTLDCPLFQKKIVVDSYDVIKHDEDDVTPVLYIHFGKLHLEDKHEEVEKQSFAERIRDIKMKRGRNLHRDLNIQTLSPDDPTPREHNEPFTVHISTDEGQRSHQPPSCQRSQQGFAWVSGIRASNQGDNAASIQDSTRVAMDTLKEQLELRGYGLEDAVLIHLYVRSMADFASINSVYCQYFKLNPPARVCVQACLPEDCTLQLDCIAHHTPPQGEEMGEGHHYDRDPAHYRTTMHVQGLSHWAPANIGPYSQTVQIGQLMFCAGMIGLCPSSMTLIEGGINAECRLSLRSVSRVLAAMHHGLGLRDVISATCYITEPGMETTARSHWDAAIAEEAQSSQLDLIESECPRIPCLVNYVVIPFLPRGASVEWHVVASTNKLTWQYSKSHCHGDGVAMETETAWCEKTGAAAVMARVDPHTDIKEVSLQAAVRGLVSSVASALTDCGIDSNDGLSYKVFHNQAQMPQDRISQVLHNELRLVHEPVTPFSTIPVTSLPSPCLLSACVWIQGQPSSDDSSDL